MNQLTDLLRSAETIAVYGCSPRPTRTSHSIARYLQQNGYRVVPINPYHDELLGEPCYPDMASIPYDVPVDIVNVYRQPRFTADAVRDVIAWSEGTDRRPVVWTQIGVSSGEAEQLAHQAGLPYVRNRCILIEHTHLSR